MAGQRSTAKPAPAPEDKPPYYIATEALFIGDNQFARAHNVGDRVPVEHVAKYGWQDGVRPPDGYEPDPDLPSDKPETPDSGQAPTSEGKDA